MQGNVHHVFHVASTHKYGRCERINCDLLEPMRVIPVKFFSKFNYFIFGYFDPTNNFFDNKNKYFLG